MVLLVFIDITAPEFTGRELIAGVIAALLLLAALIKAIKDIRTDGWQPFKRKWLTPWKTKRERQRALLNSVETMGSQVREILKEVKPNGGQSLKDQVCGLVGSVENIVARETHRDDTSSTPIFKLDATGRMYYTNCAFRELVDAEEKDLNHLNYISRMEDQDQVAYTDMLNRSIAQKRPFDKAFHFKVTGPHFAVIRLQAIPDVRHGSELKGFFGTAAKATEEDIHHTAT